MMNKESGLVYLVSGKEVVANRPEPIIANIDVVPYDRKMEPQIAIEAIEEGYKVLIVDYYSSGLAVLRALKEYVKKKYPDQSFQGQREFRSLFRELSKQIFLVVRENRLVVKKAPDIGWLKLLYPDLKEFLLPFTQVQGLNSSWQWYEKGIFIPVIKRKLFPWLGTYFPTRFEHLKLFNTWLKHYKGEKKSAIDVGIGCGVLSFQMVNHGFEKVYGTDSNPNAIIGLNEYLNKNKKNSVIELMHGDLFANCDQQTELIVFNPPWIPASYDLEGLDTAVYYEHDLFHRFFAEAINHLKPNGRVVLLFSNLAQISNLSDFHPIEKELAEGGRYEKEFFAKREVGLASNKTKRNQTWRKEEMVELWVLKMSEGSK